MMARYTREQIDMLHELGLERMKWIRTMDRRSAMRRGAVEGGRRLKISARKWRSGELKVVVTPVPQLSS